MISEIRKCRGMAELQKRFCDGIGVKSRVKLVEVGLIKAEQAYLPAIDRLISLSSLRQ